MLWPLLSIPALRPAAVAPRVAVPVVVELFTSEGCSSCPSADAALRALETAQSVAGVEVIGLGQHVDYWNRLGWKDPFSSAQFTQRQRWYAEGFKAGSYTPQAVVNGRYEFVGSQKTTLARTVAQAATVAVALNRDDPRIAAISTDVDAADVVWFGVAPDLRALFPTDEELYSGA